MAAGAVVAAIIGAGATLYSSEQQKAATQEAATKQEEAAAQARAEELRILKETGPEQQTATETIKFGVGGDKTAGSFSEFLVPRTTALGSTGGSGLGFNV